MVAADLFGRIKIRGGVNPTDVVVDVQGWLRQPRARFWWVTIPATGRRWKSDAVAPQ